MNKNILITAVLSFFILVSPVLAVTQTFYPTSGTDATPTFSYTLTSTDLSKLTVSDNDRYSNQAMWINPEYDDSKYIDFIFSPNLPYNASTINSVTLTFEWQISALWVLGAKVNMWDNNIGGYQTQELVLPDQQGVDKTDVIDMSSFLTTRDDVNNFKIRFQAKDGSCINGGFTRHDLVKIDVDYDMTPCSAYTDTNSCELDPNCDWCASCSGNKYSGGSDRCVNAGTCGYQCEFSPNPFCGAQCEINSDCANYCSGNTRYFNGVCQSGC